MAPLVVKMVAHIGTLSKGSEIYGPLNRSWIIFFEILGQGQTMVERSLKRMLLRLQLTACQSKNERELKKAKDYGLEWKRRYFELKSVANKMMEQFEHESAVQKSIIGSVKMTWFFKDGSEKPIRERALIINLETFYIFTDEKPRNPEKKVKRLKNDQPRKKK